MKLPEEGKVGRICMYVHLFFMIIACMIGMSVVHDNSMHDLHVCCIMITACMICMTVVHDYSNSLLMYYSDDDERMESQNWYSL